MITLEAVEKIIQGSKPYIDISDIEVFAQHIAFTVTEYCDYFVEVSVSSAGQIQETVDGEHTDMYNTLEEYKKFLWGAENV